MTMHETLMKHFPIRRSKEEKQRFRSWAVQQLKAAGWEARVETTSRGNHENVVAGDPEHAAVVFTAHYDTAADMLLPSLLLPRNLPLNLLYQLGVICLLAALGIGVGWGAAAVTGSAQAGLFAFLAAYVALLVLMGNGRANAHNANDNTSGVAALLQLAQTIPEEQRESCAFILFDNEERGVLGSKFYARDHLQQQYMRLTVNLDSVGDGDHLLLMVKDMARKCTGYHLLEKLLGEHTAMTTHILDGRLCFCRSDHRHFKCGIGVVACHRRPLVGFVTGRLHTRRDTVCNQTNLDYLVTVFAAWIAGINAGM